MSRVGSWMLVLAGAGAALSAVGCGTKPIPITGVVTFEGKPLANAAVTFFCQDPGGKDANGYTTDDGTFQLTTFTNNDGALPGLYKITVRHSPPAGVSTSKTAEGVQKALVKAGGSLKPPIDIPDIYSREDMTVLKHRVPDDGEVKLELWRAKP